MRTTTIEMTYGDFRVQPDGSVVMEIGGPSVGGISHKLKVKMGPTSIGYLADSMHQAIEKQQKDLDEVKAKMRGEQ